MILNDTYRKYFEHQAINHPELLHTEGSKIFEMISIEEAIGDFRTQVKKKGFIMRGVWYTYQLMSNGVGETHKVPTGGFIVAKYHSPRAGGTPEFYNAMRDSEKLADEIIEKMIADSKSGHPLFYYSLDTPNQFSIAPKPAVGDGCYSGWLVTFQYKNHWRNCITSPDAPNWIDGGETPHDL